LDLNHTEMKPREILSKTYSPNVFGTAVITDAAIPLLEKADFPRVVNVSSGLGSITHLSDMDLGVRLLVSQTPTHNLPFDLPTDPTQAYNTSKSALNALTVHYAYILKKKKESSRVVSVCPGYNATNLNNYGGTHPPSYGGAAIVRLVVAGPDSEYKTAEFRDEHGKIRAW
jgi:NAD(P)-dependent dehydrogenase (short-subunit alcohol dehydrogenase family)